MNTKHDQKQLHDCDGIEVFVNSTNLTFLSLPPAAKLGQGNIFTSVCQEFCPWGRGMHGRGVCLAGGGVHGREAYMAGRHTWQGGMHGGRHAWQGGMHVSGAYMAGGHVWQGGVRL